MLKSLSRINLDRVIGGALLSMAVTLAVIGYGVTPLLFSSLSAKVAGDLAGVLFAHVSSAVLVLLVFIIGFKLAVKQAKSVKSLWLALAVILGLKFILSPWMSRIKAAYPNGLSHESLDWTLFMSVHGVYQLGYLWIVVSLLYGAYNAFLQASIAPLDKQR